MAYPAYDQPTLRRAFRLIKKPNPLQEAILTWYYDLCPEEQDRFERMIMMIIQTVQTNSKTPFGTAQALELAGAWFMLKMGWK